MLVLITGCGGFAGPYLADELLKQGHKVRAMIRRGRALNPRLHDSEIVRGDVTNYHDVFHAMHRCDWVFHLASQSFVPDSVQNPSYTFQVNCGGTQNVLDAARAQNCKVIFAGSSEEYGLQKPEELPIDENNFCRPRSPYAVSKLWGDYTTRLYHDLYGAQNVVSRAFNHEGPQRTSHFVTSSITRQLVMVKMGLLNRLTIGDTTVTRDWSHVKDIARAYILLAERGRPGELYVSGTGVETSVQQFIDLTAQLLGMEGKFEQVENWKLKRKADVPRLRANPSKIHKLGWIPKYELMDIIHDMTDWYSGMTDEQLMTIERVQSVQ